jgi:hypothetical protein
MSKRVFITGAFKTATSSMVAAINTHPDFYILYEIFDTPKMKKRVLDFYPDAKFMHSIEKFDRERLYDEAEKFIAGKGFKYKYFGDKIAVSDKIMCYNTLRELNSIGDYILFMVRDLQYWVAKMTKKEAHIKYFSKSGDIAEMIKKYVLYFLYSYKIDCIRIKTEELINGGYNWVKPVSTYVGEDFSTAVGWWKKFNNPGKSNPKNLNWWKRHKSSTVKPGKKDVIFEASDCELWGKLIPIFKKYYDNPNTVIDNTQLDSDIAEVERVCIEHSGIQQNELFKSITYFDIVNGKIESEVK